MRDNIFVCIIWKNARVWENRIISEIEKKGINVLKKYYVTWPEQTFGLNLSAFYGDQFWDEPIQILTRGNGEFILVICEDPNPKYESRMTGRGIKTVNVNLFDLKKRVRNEILHNFAFHASDNNKETRRALALILGESLDDLLRKNAFDELDESVKKSVEGVEGWDTLAHLFYIMNETCNYVVLRGYKDLPDKHRMEVQGDIDLLVDDLQQAVILVNPKHSVKNNAFQFMNYIDLQDQNILIHFKFVGDNYYDIGFEKRILNERVLNENKIYIPSMDMYFWSLLYHGVFHKNNIKKYSEELSEIAQKLNIDYKDNQEHLCCLLADWLTVNDYKIKKHLDRDCASLQENNIPYKKLIDTSRKIYFYQGYYDRHIILTVFFDEEMIRIDPEFLTRIIKPCDFFIDLERHVLRKDATVYQILCQHQMQGEYLWRYTIRYGELAELKYVHTLRENYVYKGFLNQISEINGPVHYRAQGKMSIFREKTYEEDLKKLYLMGKEKFYKESIRYIRYIVDKYKIEEKKLDGMAWDAMPKNMIRLGDEWWMFDQDACLAESISVLYFIIIFVEYVKCLFAWDENEEWLLFKELCKEFEEDADESLFNSYRKAQIKLVDDINDLERIKQTGNSEKYSIYMIVNHYIPDIKAEEEPSAKCDISECCNAPKKKHKFRMFACFDKLKTEVSEIYANVCIIGSNVALLHQKNDDYTQVKLDAVLDKLTNIQQVLQNFQHEKQNDRKRIAYLLEERKININKVLDSMDILQEKVDAIHTKTDCYTQVKLDAALDKLSNIQQMDTQLISGEKHIIEELNNKVIDGRIFSRGSLDQRAFDKGACRKIHIYIVTYKKNDALNENLRSLYDGAVDETFFDVTIIANHPDVIIHEENVHANLRVLLNNTRTEYSWGNLAKDWNFAILDAFGRWDNPKKTEYCILAQNDVIWSENWQKNLEKMGNIEFLSQPFGDQLMILTINAIRKVGFFDERFTTLHYHEEDYFLRAELALTDRASINGVPEKENEHYMATSFNYKGSDIFIRPTLSGICLFDDTLHTAKTHDAHEKFFMQKWGIKKPIGKIENRMELLEIARKISRPKEVNWYPFFWDGYEEIKDKFQYND